MLADRVQQRWQQQDQREWDAFLSYARIDGRTSAERCASSSRAWRPRLVRRDRDHARYQPSPADGQGLQKARAGIVVLTPAYLVGRFWTERELGALLHKEMLIPVLHG